MAQNIYDGVLPHGCFDVTVLETLLPYVADSFQWNTDATVLRSLNSSGNPKRQKVVEKFTDGSADFQIADVNVAAPSIGYHFAIDANQDGTVEPYIVTKVGRVFQQDGEYKCKVDVARCVNPFPYFVGVNTAAKSLTNATPMTNVTVAAYFPPGEVIKAATPYAASGLPTNVSINTTSGLISGTPNTVGTFASTITVNSASGLVGALQITWTVA